MLRGPPYPQLSMVCSLGHAGVSGLAYFFSSSFTSTIHILYFYNNCRHYSKRPRGVKCPPIPMLTFHSNKSATKWPRDSKTPVDATPYLCLKPFKLYILSTYFFLSHTEVRSQGSQTISTTFQKPHFHNYETHFCFHI